MGFKIEEITVLNDLQMRLAELTDEAVLNAERKLAVSESKALAERESHEPLFKPSDVIGVIENTTTKALYALWCLMIAEERMEKAKAGLALHEIEEKDHEDKSAALHLFAGVVHDLFWAQARIELGFLEQVSTELHEGWLLVRGTDEPPQNPFALLRRIGRLE